MAILLSVYELSGRAGGAIALLALAELIPEFVVGSIAGAVVDRATKRRTLIRADVVRALVSLALIPAVLTGMLGAVYLLVAVAASAATFVSPARHALLPSFVDPAQLQRANGLAVVGQQVAFIVGPPLAAVVFYAWGAVPALLIDSSTFVVSAVGLWLMASEGGQRLPSGIAATGVAVLKEIVRESLDGLRYVATTPLLIAAGLAAGGLYASAGLNNTAMIFFISQDLGRSPSDIAWLSSANGIAQVFAGGSVIALASRLRPELVLVVSAGMLTLGGTIVASALALPLLIAGVIATSLGNAPYNIASTSIEQTYVDPSYLGRAKAALSLLGTVVFVAATGIAGYLVGPLGGRWVMALSAGVLLLTLVVTAFVYVPAIHAARRRASASAKA